MSFKYHSLQDEQRLRFYQTPKILIDGKKYKDLGLAEKQMYAVLRDRQELSRKNRWIDENGNIYLIFTVEQLMQKLNIAKSTAIRYKQNLAKFNLLKEVTMGQGKPNRIYIGKPDYSCEDVINKPFDKKCRKVTPRSEEKSFLGVKKVHPNDTEYSDTDFNENKKHSASSEARLVSGEKDKEISDRKKKERENNKIANEFFEECWKMYPNKRNKGQVSNSKKKQIYKLGDEFKRCIERYIKDVEYQRANGFETLKFKNGSTFFNSGYVDYLDENYEDLKEGAVISEGDNEYRGRDTGSDRKDKDKTDIHERIMQIRKERGIEFIDEEVDF